MGAAQADVPLDYLIQQVCDDGNGGHTSADPITCPGSARKLRVGELLPYHKWDGSSASTANQIADEFPVADLYGRLRVVSTFFYDSQSAFITPYFNAADPQVVRSAYDILGADGSYVAGMGTYDVGRGWQPFWHNSSCSLSDSWIFFPKNASIPLIQGNINAVLTARFAQCPTVNSFSNADTVWNYYSGTAYESGKLLNTIKVFHFSGSTINSSSIEMFYFTKEYGKTRWEAWQASSVVSGPNAGVVARCPTGTNNGVSYFGSTTYYLVDCHDWSNVVADPNGGWDPSGWHVDPIFTGVNLLTNTHMQCTSGGIAKDCNIGGSCQTITPWGRYGNLNWAFIVFPQLQQSENCGLQFSIPSAWDGSQSIYQDTATPPAGYSSYYYGAAIWTPGNGSPVQVLVRVFEMDSSYNVLTYHDFTANVTSERRFVQGTFSKLSQTAHMRFQVYPLAANIQYDISDAWVGPKP